MTGKYYYCKCTLGLAKVCTHVAAISFWTEISGKVLISKIVFDHKTYWMAPSNKTSSLQRQKLINIDFSSPQLKRESIENALLSPKKSSHIKNSS